MKLVSEVGDKAGLGAIIFLTVHTLDRKDAFITAFAFCLSVTVTGILKLLFAEGRPYFLNDKIHPSSCGLEYGNPSGHTCVTTCVYTTLYFAVMVKKLKIKSKVCLLAGLVGVFLFIATVAFSRAYNGVHSYDQLLNGFVVGLLLAFILTSELVYEYLAHLREVIMPFPDISNRPYQLSLIPSANHSTLNYATVGFLCL